VFDQIFSQAVIDADVDGSSVDIGQDLRVAYYCLNVGGVTGVGTLDVSIEESADGSTWKPLTSFTQTVDGNTHQVLPVKSNLRYRRAVIAFEDTGDTEAPEYVACAYADLHIYRAPASRH